MTKWKATTVGTSQTIDQDKVQGDAFPVAQSTTQSYGDARKVT